VPLLQGVRIVILVGEEYEDLELWYPKLRLEEAGASVVLAGGAVGQLYAGKHGYPCRCEAILTDIAADDFHGIVIPGGWMPDALRRDPAVLALVQEFPGRANLWRRSATVAGSPSRPACTGA